MSADMDSCPADGMDESTKEPAQVAAQRMNESARLRSAGALQLPVPDDRFAQVLSLALRMPGVRVNRVEFLLKVFRKYGVDEAAVRDGEISVSLAERKQAAEYWIRRTVVESSTASLSLGLPSGFTMAAAVPADIVQNMAFSVRLVQELAYIYGYDELVDRDGELQTQGVVLFLGVMFSGHKVRLRLSAWPV